MTRTKDLLAAAAAMTDKESDDLAERMNDELVGSDPTGTLRALRSLGQGRTGRELPKDELETGR